MGDMVGSHVIYQALQELGCPTSEWIESIQSQDSEVRRAIHALQHQPAKCSGGLVHWNRAPYGCISQGHWQGNTRLGADFIFSIATVYIESRYCDFPTELGKDSIFQATEHGPVAKSVDRESLRGLGPRVKWRDFSKLVAAGENSTGIGKYV